MPQSNKKIISSHQFIWTQDKITKVAQLYSQGLSMKEVGSQIGLSIWSVRSAMKRYNISRRKSSDTNKIHYLHSPLSFAPKYKLTSQETILKTAGLMLYWGEGFKRNADGVDFANSDPYMISIFIKFLRQIYHPDESRFRVLLYTHHISNIEQQLNYWSNILNIPVHQFSKPYIRSNSNEKHDKMPHGLVHVRYYDKKLIARIMSDLNELINRWDDGAVKRASL